MPFLILAFQAGVSLAQWFVEQNQFSQFLFLSSDYTRAHETAEVALLSMSSQLASTQYPEVSSQSKSTSIVLSSPQELCSLSSAPALATPDAQPISFLEICTSPHSLSNMNSECKVYCTPLLRERYFGTLDTQSISLYTKVWEKDAFNPAHTDFDNENCFSVASRGLQLISYLEKLFHNIACILVSHGDVLQILQAAFEGISLSSHRSIDHLHNAEWRVMTWKESKRYLEKNYAGDIESDVSNNSQSKEIAKSTQWQLDFELLAAKRLAKGGLVSKHETLSSSN